MEEWVGGIWDRFITRLARRDYPEAVVRLADLEKTLGVLFRALGGDSGLRVASVGDQRHGARRRLLSRIAGSDTHIPTASLDLETLRLPSTIALFPKATHNRDLYLWLIALAAHGIADDPSMPWIIANQQATQRALSAFPGLLPRYQRLVTALLAERLAPENLPADEAAQEQAIREALLVPGSVSILPPLTRARAKSLQPVALWLYPSPTTPRPSPRPPSSPPAPRGDSQEVLRSDKQRHGERQDMPDNPSPLMLLFRAESLLSWADYLKVNRAADDDPDGDGAAKAAEMDTLVVTQDSQPVASKVRFDLDLPSAAEDDTPLGPGIALPEWDYRRQQLKSDHCRLQLMETRGATPIPLPERLRRPARKLKNQFAALAPVRRWQKAQPDGSELDIDACVRGYADQLAGHRVGFGGYLAQRRQERDLACLILADLSLSTDAWVSDEYRVIDVIRDSLLLFGEAMTVTKDAFACYGFSSLRRSQVRFHELKSFAKPWDATARGRISALKPGYYTRMGAAIRQATTLLTQQRASLPLLLLLSDGKPHDMDYYEGRYGIEDTRHALMSARHSGVKPFCVTVDREGASYLPHLFGAGGFTVLRKPEELPQRLPLLYAQLTGR